MKQKGIGAAAVIVIIIVIAAAGVGAYVMVSGDEEGPPGEEEEEEEESVGSASSLDFKIEVDTPETEPLTYRYRARNLDTYTPDIRVDFTMEEMDWGFILKGSTEQGWVYTGGEWYEFTEMPGYDWSTYWSEYYSNLDDYITELSDWTEGEWEWSSGGYSYKIYDIEVNPSLPDSVFQPS